MENVLPSTEDIIARVERLKERCDVFNVFIADLNTFTADLSSRVKALEKAASK